MLAEAILAILDHATVETDVDALIEEVDTAADDVAAGVPTHAYQVGWLYLELATGVGL